ncbi:MAG TPA: DegT/DnrJ/EryC1/StrS aminotransferase family protein [Thermoanaerobaculia bacterium]|jgi:perosamine synthetase
MAQGVPFFRPEIGSEEIQEVVSALESGWLTTGPKVKTFEEEFAKAVGAEHAIAVNSCTAALHLAVEALGLRAGEAVVVPTMTFAATAEVVRYLGAYPLLVDCEPGTLNIDLGDARRKIRAYRAGEIPGAPSGGKVVGIMPVHVGGLMADVDAIRAFADEHGLWIAEDAAHAFPASWRPNASAPWQRSGEGTAAISCFSFYANKTITTGEGGMATTSDAELASRIRLMSLHGLSQDAWRRFEKGGTWDYRILAPGFKYNLTDVAAAIGIHQLRKAEAMRVAREAVADRYDRGFAEVDELETPVRDANRIHSWHLYPIRLNLDRLGIGRNAFIDELKSAGVGCSVHWRPLHLHPYYQETFGWRPDQLPVASAEWERLVSLPIFPSMREDEIDVVIERVRSLCEANRAASSAGRRASR